MKDNIYTDNISVLIITGVKHKTEEDNSTKGQRKYSEMFPLTYENGYSLTK